MFRTPRFETERLVVRMAGEADAPAIVRYWTANRAFLAPWDPARPAEFFTEGFWRDQVRRNREELEMDRALRLFVFSRAADGEVVGTVNFTEFVRGIFHACYLGYGLSAANEGMGLMREALRPAISHVFGAMRMHRIMANYIPHNRRSGNVLKSLGFAVEGYARDFLRINGRWEDHVLTALVNPEWRDEHGMRG